MSNSDFFNELYEKILDKGYNIAADKLATKLNAKGIAVTEEIKEKIIYLLKSGQISKNDLNALNFTSIKLTVNDFKKAIKEVENLINNSTDVFIENNLSEMVDELSKEFIKDWPRNLKEQIDSNKVFKKEFNELWSIPLEKLKMCITFARELGNEASLSLQDENYSPKIDLLSRLHGRGCQVALEVYHLLMEGFADGAMARWRTLHEISVVALFISDHDDDLAQRYFDHEIIESFKAAKQYQEYSERLGYEKMTEIEFNEFKSDRDEIIKKYEENFDDSYGWANKILKKRVKQFEIIEKKIELDHLRCHYKMASYNVHANPKGVMFKHSMPNRDCIITGPSIFGLAEPGQNTAISLNKLVLPLYSFNSDMKFLVKGRVLHKIVEDVCDSFIEVHEHLKENDLD